MARMQRVPDNTVRIVRSLVAHSLYARAFSPSDSVTPATDLSTFTRDDLRQWLNTSASPSYRTFINNHACPMDPSLATHDFCVQDTILSQSPILGQITAQSSLDYQLANQVLGTIMPVFVVVLLILILSMLLQMSRLRKSPLSSQPR